MDANLYQTLIAKIPLFKPLQPEELAIIIKISKLFRVKKGITVVKEGSKGSAMYMLVEGKAVVDKLIPGANKQTRLATIDAPSVFGEMSLIDGNPRSASVSTITDAVLLKVDLDTFNQLRSAYHPAAFKVVRQLAYTLCERLEEKTERIMEFYKNPQKNLGRIEDMFLKKNL